MQCCTTEHCRVRHCLAIVIAAHLTLRSVLYEDVRFEASVWAYIIVWRTLAVLHVDRSLYSAKVINVLLLWSQQQHISTVIMPIHAKFSWTLSAYHLSPYSVAASICTWFTHTVILSLNNTHLGVIVLDFSSRDCCIAPTVSPTPPGCLALSAAAHLWQHWAKAV